ncbi:DUF1214 domain-containing protein [Embleya sp. NPDC020886]|uniref:DUF1214 domain-containing protein n=1 Tax=Embleya sp. NPDC020886 TaxID=3363980 RepID=UPI00378A621E
MADTFETLDDPAQPAAPEAPATPERPETPETAATPETPATPEQATAACFATWDRFCAELADLGHTIRAGDHPDPADGLRHLTRVAIHALQSTVEHGDPAFPTFHRFDDDVVKWGGPNVDNVYLRARVDADHGYRVTGNLAGVRNLIVSVVEGDMQMEQYGVFAECDIDALDVAEDGSFELVVAAVRPGEHTGPWLRLDRRARYLSIRVYVCDLDLDRTGEFVIERIGSAGRFPAPLTPTRLAARIAEATVWQRATMEYWGPFMDTVYERAGGPNRISPPASVPGGAQGIRYGGGAYELGPDQALLIETEAPEADYWSVMLYSRPWFESLDIHNRQNALNGQEAHVDADGVVRIVVAHTDPGLPNWLDTEGRSAGHVAWRWVRARTAPTPVAHVVPFADLDDRVPADARRTSRAERAVSLARRRAHFARRFRR